MCATLSISAQQRGQFREFNPEETATRQADQIKKACSINDEQYAAVFKLYKEQAEQNKAERESIMKAGNNGGGRPQMNMELFRARQDKMNAALKEILTEEQYAAYEKMQKERMNRRGGFGQGRPRRNG